MSASIVRGLSGHKLLTSGYVPDCTVRDCPMSVSHDKHWITINNTEKTQRRGLTTGSFIANMATAYWSRLDL
uniref:Uncharacterized protein n=1 Tax=Rhizophagus irregularis (strain DAOM 181602 / DAOM 197198 / MUCL 43194) TaxID=747089 RepID=U9TW70_RHIID